MAIHIEPAAGTELALTVRVYSGVPDDAPAYNHRLDYDAVCTAVWLPRDHKARIEGLNGRLTYRDAIDIFEALWRQYSVSAIEWERADGRRHKKWRKGPRRWVSDRRKA